MVMVIMDFDSIMKVMQASLLNTGFKSTHNVFILLIYDYYDYNDM